MTFLRGLSYILTIVLCVLIDQPDTGEDEGGSENHGEGDGGNSDDDGEDGGNDGLEIVVHRDGGGLQRGLADGKEDISDEGSESNNIANLEKNLGAEGAPGGGDDARTSDEEHDGSGDGEEPFHQRERRIFLRQIGIADEVDCTENLRGNTDEISKKRIVNMHGGIGLSGEDENEHSAESEDNAKDLQPMVFLMPEEPDEDEGPEGTRAAHHGGRNGVGHTHAEDDAHLIGEGDEEGGGHKGKVVLAVNLFLGGNALGKEEATGPEKEGSTDDAETGEGDGMDVGGVQRLLSNGRHQTPDDIGSEHRKMTDDHCTGNSLCHVCLKSNLFFRAQRY